MLNQYFVFDAVCHVYNLGDENLSSHKAAPLGRASITGLGDTWRAPENRELYDDGYVRNFTTADMHEMIFEKSDTDMVMAQAVPIFDWFKDGFAPVQSQYEFAAAYPEKVLFCGGVDPVFHGVDKAKDEIRRQADEMGARSFKFYNAHPGGRSWRCDDKELAYPLYETILESGVDVIQFHKGVPFGPIFMEDFKPNDLQAVAYDFPDLKIIIHHLAEPYVDECISIAARFPNVYLALSGTAGNYLVAPRKFEQQLGQLLQECGSEKLLWGSEAALYGPPQPYLEALVGMSIPKDLQDGWGFPDVTEQDRHNILGLNFARLLGIDVESAPRNTRAES
jgi:predicted TIM-barrel fold metal-dependent hydrolase